MNRMHKIRSEATEQKYVISWCFHHEGQYPELKWIYHCPNGGSRQKAEAGNLKAQGVKSGVPDLHLPIAKGRYIGLYIEMKFNKGTLQASQKEWLAGMKAAGHFACTCYGYECAIEVIESYMRLNGMEEMQMENGAVLRPSRLQAKG